ncbi:hypothetical protein MMC14_009386 [Varicellaria rhodocarpa]|nr:hypothetical protein [Varicellaria rhodocarpa]
MGYYTDPAPNNGVNGEKIPLNIPIYMSIGAFTAVAWYNIIELNIQVFLTFKRHRGLYFWSLLISSYGCVLHALGFLLKFFQLTSNDYISVSIITIGWYSMVTGQAIVLYSRLHLVVKSTTLLRAVLIMIIADAVCLHIPTTVLTYGSNVSDGSNQVNASFIHAFNIMERIQMTCFCIQEFVISGIYVYSTIQLLRPIYHGRTRKALMQLIWINVIIIAMDVLLLIMEYTNYYEIEATLKAMVYSIKLKLEFAVLNQLMTLANSSVNNATHLTLMDEGAAPVPEPKGRTVRSKSLSYLTGHFPKHSGSREKSPQGRNGSTYSTSTGGTWSSFGMNPRAAKFDWVPSLDRKRVIEPDHIEDANDPHNVFTNPAAVFRPDGPKRFHPHDLSGIADTPPSPLSPHPSPAFTGSTFGPNNSTSRFSLGRRVGVAPLRLDLTSSPQIGVLRSNRPSVSDWAPGPDSANSPTSSIHQLNPDGIAKAISTKPIRSRNMGMDFMTSAI